MAAGASPPKRRTHAPRRIGAFSDEHFRQRQEDRADRWQIFVQRQIWLIIGTFVVANASVLLLIFGMWRAQANAPPPAAGTAPQPQIITVDVVLRLITATSAQLGALALGVGAALYRPNPRQ